MTLTNCHTENRKLLKLEKIETIDELMPLKNEWNDALANSENDVIFLRWEWIVTWWKYFNKDNQLFIFIVKEDDQITAIFPLMIRQTKYKGINLNKISIISNEYTPFCDFILVRKARESVGLLFQYLNNINWYIFAIGQLNAASTSFKLIKKLSNTHNVRIFKKEEFKGDPHIKGDILWQDYHAGLSKHLKKNLAQASRRLNMLGRLNMVEVNTIENLDEKLQMAFKTEASGWKGKSGTAISCIAEAEGFYTEFAHIAIKEGWLRLLMLNLDNENLAFLYELKYKNQFESCKLGYNQDYAKYSPGSLLILKAIEKMFDQGFKKYSLQGEADGYKRQWVVSADNYIDLLVFKKGVLQNVLYFFQFGLKRFLKSFSLLVKISKQLKFISKIIRNF